jgi:hypothetical protein
MLRIIIAALLGAALSGCVTPTTIDVEHKDADGSYTKITATALPKDWKNLSLKWRDIVELQGGEAVTVTTDWEAIESVIEDVVPAVMCAQNPALCAVGD